MLLDLIFSGWNKVSKQQQQPKTSTTNKQTKHEIESKEKQQQNKKTQKYTHTNNNNNNKNHHHQQQKQKQNNNKKATTTNNSNNKQTTSVTRTVHGLGYAVVFRLHGQGVKRSNALVRSMIIERVQTPSPARNELKLFDTSSDGVGFILSGTVAGLPLPVVK